MQSVTRRSLAQRTLWLVIGLLLNMSAGGWTNASDRPSTTRPNILLAIADDWGYGHAGAYGCRWVDTPAFDRVAKEGLLFRHCYTPNAKCAPSRACLVTGRNSWQLEEACNHICDFPVKFRSYAEVLPEHGYFVGTTGKGWGPGIAQNAAGKPRQMTGRPFNKRTAPPPAKHIGNNDYAGNFADFLSEAPRDQPWCFWYGAVEPHRGYEFGVGSKQGGKSLSDVDRVPAFWPDNDTVRQDMLDYGFEVTHFDRHLGRMLKLIEERGELDNTLVLVTSDHGMPFPRCKGQAYDMSNHIPLAIMWGKGITSPGRVIDDYVSLIDVAPTFLEAAGVAWESSGMAASPGRSLFDIFKASTGGRVNPARDHVLIGKERHDIGRPNDWGYPIRGIVADGMLYVHNYETGRWPAGNPETGYLNCDGGATKTDILTAHRREPQYPHWQLCFGKRPTEELYDLSVDPDCVNNLAARAEHAQTRDALRKRMETELTAQGDPRMSGNGAIFESYRYVNDDTRSFYERYMSGEKLRAGWVEPTDFEPAALDD